MGRLKEKQQVALVRLRHVQVPLQSSIPTRHMPVLIQSSIATPLSYCHRFLAPPRHKCVDACVRARGGCWWVAANQSHAPISGQNKNGYAWDGKGYASGMQGMHGMVKGMHTRW